MINRLRSMSRTSKLMLALGAILLALAASGALRADSGVQVTSEQAVEIAREQVEFEAENVQVRLVRQGFNLRPVWAVSLSIPGEESGSFQRLSTVEVDGITGEVLRLVTTRS